MRQVAALLEYDQWVGWRYEPDERGRLTKVLKNPHNGANAKTNDPATWGTYEQALAAKERYGLEGIGFAFHPQATDIMGVDFDHCVENGVIHPEVQEMVKALNSYTEFSPSGEGIHVLCRGVLPANIPAYKPDLEGLRSPPPLPTICEMYDNGRWFTITGDHIEGTPVTIETRHREVMTLHREVDARIRQHKQAIKALRNMAKSPINGNGNGAYAQAALRNEIETLRHTGEGARNSQLFASTCNLLELVNAGELGEAEAEAALTSASQATGLGQTEIERTMASAKKHIGDKKREIPPLLESNGATPKSETVPDLEEQANDPPVEESSPPPTFFKFLTLSELKTRPEKEWLYSNLLGRQDYGMIFGDSGTGKTFAVLNLILSGVTGHKLANRFNVSKPLSIAYAAGEGVSGLPKRFTAAENYFKALHPDYAHLIEANLHISLDIPQLFDEEAQGSIYTFIGDWKDSGLGEVDLLVLDTLHAASFGADEDRAKDAGLILKAVKAARDNLGCAVLLVHHANRQGNYRGSSALHGAMDLMIQTKENGNVFKAECFKLKDAEHFEPLFFRLAPDQDSGSVFCEWVEERVTKLDEEGKGKKGKAKREILGLLTQEPGLIQSEIVGRLEYARNTIRDALQELEVEGKINSEDGGERNKKSYYPAIQF